ncbi:MAG TPA: multidrug effflux MFS transporter [Parachlamydiaceae bacterium]|nr:multidrug effflux MFS transporter [Parachlamydiaceae bacterium]
MSFGHNTKRLSTGLLIALVGFPQISETIYTPALPNVAKGLHASVYMVEATLAIYFLGFAFGVFLWGTISDWCGRRIAMLTGLAIYGFGTLGCANADSVEALLAWRFLQAFGASVGSVITQTILRDAYEGAERTKLFAVMSGALAFSPAIGPLLGGFISEFLGWRANFWMLVFMGVVLGVWSYLALPETRPKHLERLTKSRILDLFKEMAGSCVLWGHILLIGAANGILFGFFQEAPFVFIAQLGIKPSHYGFFGLLIATATILAARISYRQCSRFTANSFIQAGAACVFAGGLIFTSIVLTGVFELKVAGVLGATIALFLVFFGIGLIVPNSLSQALRPYQKAAGTAGSIFGGLYYCLIAGFTWCLSAFHEGTALPLPVYITILGVVLGCGSQMIRVTITETSA